MTNGLPPQGCSPALEVCLPDGLLGPMTMIAPVWLEKGHTREKENEGGGFTFEFLCYDIVLLTFCAWVFLYFC